MGVGSSHTVRVAYDYIVTVHVIVGCSLYDTTPNNTNRSLVSDTEVNTGMDFIATFFPVG